MSLYTKRGVSAQKEDVQKATEKLDKGLYPHAFCKIYPDYLGKDDAWVNLMHADGAGSKSILAYLYWKETGDISVWKGIAKDAIAMNLDDLLCVGIYDNLLFSSTIDRNKRIIPGEVLEILINSSQEFFDELRSFGVNIQYLGGETADVGDLVRTIAVNGTMTARWPKQKLISNEKIRAGDIIVGLSSSGQSTYEKEYNSGIGSNGLTSARHDLLHKTYSARFHESYDGSLDDAVVYIGPHLMTDELTNPERNKTADPEQNQGADPEQNQGADPEQNQRADPKQNQRADPERSRRVKTLSAVEGLTIGQLLLSPTRTYAPVMKLLLEKYFDQIHGLIHCSGGGQTKCMKYLPGNFRVIKDNLFDPPIIFKLIQQTSHVDNREMYQVFNMGHRMDIFADAAAAEEIIQVARQFDIEAKVVGRIEAAEKKELLLKVQGEEIIY